MYFIIPGGPPTTLDTLLFDKRNSIEEWCESKQGDFTQLPFYSSNDIRSCAYKLACVDADAFPAGVNHINRTLLSSIASKRQEQILIIAPNVRHIGLISELHT